MSVMSSLLSWLLLVMAAGGGLQTNSATAEVTTAANSAAVKAYWHTMLPNTPMPSAVLELLTPLADDVENDNYKWGVGPPTTDDVEKDNYKWGRPPTTEDIKKDNYKWGVGPPTIDDVEKDNYKWGRPPTTDDVEKDNYKWGRPPTTDDIEKGNYKWGDQPTKDNVEKSNYKWGDQPTKDDTEKSNYKWGDQPTSDVTEKSNYKWGDQPTTNDAQRSNYKWGDQPTIDVAEKSNYKWGDQPTTYDVEKSNYKWGGPPTTDEVDKSNYKWGGPSTEAEDRKRGPSAGAEYQKDDQKGVPLLEIGGSHIGGVKHKHGSMSNKVFLEEALKRGSTINCYVLPSHTSGAPLLQRDVADSIPMSMRTFTNILRMFAPRSNVMATDIWSTLEQCEHPEPIKGETKACATSVESMVEFVASVLGVSTYNLRAFSSPDAPAEGIMPARGFKVVAATRLTEANDTITCHGGRFPFALFMCHSLNPTRVYSVTLEGEDVGASQRMEVLAVCHLDTSAFDPARMPPHVKPGEAPLCHFISRDSIIWAAASGHSAA